MGDTGAAWTKPGNSLFAVMSKVGIAALPAGMSKHIMFGFRFLEVVDASGVVRCKSFVNDGMVFGSMIV